MEEFEIWCYECIKTQKNIPTFVFDILDIGLDAFIKTKNYIFLRDNSGKEFTKGERNTLRAISYLRGRKTEADLRDLGTTSKTVLKALENNPHILERFKEVFPFIKLDF